ncbi:hypothetical protein [Streptomyces sp. SID13726]|uniref:hypothetical protein n=1 Tax=Streptomyces sp. SID13726 TaxID=2706058 RepID=UPI0013BC03F7|nr:hypothetical protein [Streptomyces sp. SID13726]NEB00592.1 hypothetical protein [Streptomyces sp. SID13726]
MTSYGLDTYLGWEQLQHLEDCKKPSWDIASRTDENARRYHGYGEPPLAHKCADECCTHGNTFTKTLVRIVCHSCGTARVVTVESSEDTGVSETSSRWLPYGLPPRPRAGLLLWPARPWLDVGGARGEEPYDFVVTRTGVKAVTKDTVVGQLTQGRGKLGGLVWTALAVPDPEGRYGYGQHLRFMHSNDGQGRGGSPLRTVLAAARWVGARLAEMPGGGL